MLLLVSKTSNIDSPNILYVEIFEFLQLLLGLLENKVHSVFHEISVNFSTENFHKKHLHFTHFIADDRKLY